MFNFDAKPSRANMKKRLRAAHEAVAAAEKMASQGRDQQLVAAVRMALDAVRAAEERVAAAKGTHF